MSNTRLAVVALLLLAAGSVFATPPDRIRLGFNDTTHTLVIAVHHPTFSVSAHHVAKIAVMLNDSLVVLQQFGSQTNKQELDMQFVIPDAQPGDRLTVTAVCNIFGKRTETLVLPARSP
jgi:hypothetical protein